MLSPDQRERLPQRCNPVDLQHHIQTELLRRVHLGIDIGIPHHSRTTRPLLFAYNMCNRTYLDIISLPLFSPPYFTFLTLKQKKH